MNRQMYARDLIPGDTFKGRTPFGEVTYLVTYVQADEQHVIVYTLREYHGQVANYDRTVSRDHVMGGKR